MTQGESAATREFRQRFRKELAEEDAARAAAAAEAFDALCRRLHRDRPRPSTATSHPLVAQLHRDFATIETAIETGVATLYEAHMAQLFTALAMLDQLMIEQHWYPASHYKDKYGIPPPRLRQAKRRNQIAAIVVGGEPRYFEGDVRRRWPQDFAE